MGTRASLLCLRAVPNAGDGGYVRLNPVEGEFLREATNCLPLLWATLFTLSDLVEAAHEGDVYPVLLAERGAATARSMARCAALRPLLPAGAGVHLRAWDEMLGQATCTAFGVETLELWAMAPDEFFDQIAGVLSWIDAPQREHLRAVRMLTGLAADSRGSLRATDDLEELLLGTA